MGTASYRQILWLVTLAATAIIATALASEIFGGLVPCALCLQQRIPYYIAVPVLVLMLLANDKAPPALLGLVGLVFAVGAGLAGYHAGVEYGWWAGPAACGAGANLPSSLAELNEALKTAKVVRCDEAAFSLFGLSMAGYNFIASLVLSGLCVAGLRARR
jgi:disulfide bond formation protein DsbB